MAEDKEKDQWAKLDQLFMDRGFERAYNVTPREVRKAYPNVRWTLANFKRAMDTCIFRKWNPMPHADDVWIYEMSGTLLTYASPTGAMRCLIKHGVVADVLSVGVVYEGESYTEDANVIDHYNTVDTTDNSVPVRFGYICVARPSGRVLKYILHGSQLLKSSRAGGRLWKTERHAMMIKTMYKEAWNRLRAHLDAKVAAQFLDPEPEPEMYDDADDVDSTPADTPDYQDTMPPMDMPPMEADDDDSPF